MLAQQEFDAKYISSSEITSRLGIHRSVLRIAWNTGRLPEPISVNSHSGQAKFHLWVREEVEDFLTGWEAQLNARRGVVRD